MQIQCECGKFKAELTSFPKNSPGRLMCYCDDCQTYLNRIGRSDLLDENGGTEIIPSYPSEYKIIAGLEFLKCNQLSPTGLYRWSASCCNTPLANTRPGFPWIGNLRRVFTVKDSTYLERTFGPIKSRILAKFAKGTPPAEASQKLGIKDVFAVAPFLLKGVLTGKAKSSPFFKTDGKKPIAEPQLLPK